jgi:hypothetical protein
LFYQFFFFLGKIRKGPYGAWRKTTREAHMVVRGVWGNGGSNPHIATPSVPH